MEYQDSNDGNRIRHISLDHKLGNKEGSFDTSGFQFSQSARDITLVGTILHATLCTSNGVWWDDQVAIEINIPTISESEAEPAITFRRCDELRLRPCRNLRLIEPFMLAAECLQVDRSYKDTYLDLDLCLGTKNETFNREGTNFSWKAKNTQLIGTTLYSDLPGQDGTLSRASIELASIANIRDRTLRPLRSLEPRNLELEVLGDGSSDQGWLDNAHKVRLVNCQKKRRWYLIAECVVSPGWTRESVIRLHDILGPHDDEMFCIPFFSSPDIPESARSTSLKNGVLTATFQGKDNEWVERSVDLRQIVASGKGELIL
jgi:hypothetical protein